MAHTSSYLTSHATLHSLFFLFIFILVCTLYTDFSDNNNTTVSARLTNHTTKSVLKCLMSIKGAGEYFFQVSYGMGARVREYCILLVSMKFKFLPIFNRERKQAFYTAARWKYQPMCIYPTSNPSGSHASILGFICTLPTLLTRSTHLSVFIVEGQTVRSQVIAKSGHLRHQWIARQSLFTLISTCPYKMLSVLEI